jgi:hypothetical protein
MGHKKAISTQIFIKYAIVYCSFLRTDQYNITGFFFPMYPLFNKNQAA